MAFHFLFYFYHGNGKRKESMHMVGKEIKSVLITFIYENNSLICTFLPLKASI